jgi:hypothetical protein
MAQRPRIDRCLVGNGSGDGGRVLNFDAGGERNSRTPIADESLGIAMLL